MSSVSLNPYQLRFGYVDTMTYTKENHSQVWNWLSSACDVKDSDGDILPPGTVSYDESSNDIYVSNHIGVQVIKEGDVVVRMFDGCFYPVASETFHAWFVKGGEEQKVSEAELTSRLQPTVTIDEVLMEAKAIVGGARREEYGAPEETHADIAKYWSALFGWNITPHQVALAMVLLKIVRASNSQTFHKDSYVDIAGYAGIAGMIKSTEG